VPYTRVKMSTIDYAEYEEYRRKRGVRQRVANGFN
jgi:hypothetical protein